MEKPPAGGRDGSSAKGVIRLVGDSDLSGASRSGKTKASPNLRECSIVAEPSGERARDRMPMVQAGRKKLLDCRGLGTGNK